MKIFPTNNYEFELTKESSDALSELEKNTLITESLVSEWTKKAFIGQVNENGFKVLFGPYATLSLAKTDQKMLLKQEISSLLLPPQS